ncbi:MAG: LysE family transporter [Ignavibacteria bacterium]|nr:LysE family transporter [Ignavibacteria bacterium]
MITGLVVGLLIGFIFSMPPLGPTYFLIIDRGLKKEPSKAVAIGVGAGFMDMVYILFAYGGVSVIASFLPESADNFFRENEVTLKLYLAIAGCIIIILYGLKVIKSKRKINDLNKESESGDFRKKIEEVESSLKRTEEGIDKIFHLKPHSETGSGIGLSFFTGVFSCLTSPTLAASWFATVSYLKSYGLINSSYLSGLMLSVGVLIGTSVWFYLLTKLIFKHTDRINPDILRKMNFTMGIFLVLIGIALVIKISISYL